MPRALACAEDNVGASPGGRRDATVVERPIALRSATALSAPASGGYTPVTDPEFALQESAGALGNWIAGCIFHALALPVRFRAWLKLRRECSWCDRRLGGNPLPRHVTHGICPACSEKMRAEILALNAK